MVKPRKKLTISVHPYTFIYYVQIRKIVNNYSYNVTKGGRKLKFTSRNVLGLHSMERVLSSLILPPFGTFDLLCTRFLLQCVSDHHQERKVCSFKSAEFFQSLISLNMSSVYCTCRQEKKILLLSLILC